MSRQVTVYTMDYCPYCDRAKLLLKQRGIAFTEVHVATDDDRHWQELYKRSGMRTMPQIYVADDEGAVERLVGGFNDLAELDARDKLTSLKPE